MGRRYKAAVMRRRNRDAVIFWVKASLALVITTSFIVSFLGMPNSWAYFTHSARSPTEVLSRRATQSDLDLAALDDPILDTEDEKDQDDSWVEEELVHWDGDGEGELPPEQGENILDEDSAEGDDETVDEGSSDEEGENEEDQ